MHNKLTDHCKLTNEGGLQYYVVDKMDDVKKEMLRLLKVIDDICVECGLKYWIDGGTLIGAIRHGGFIPWDDDIDISMHKHDYNILIHQLENREGNKYSNEYLLYSGTNKNKHCCNFLCSKINIYGRIKGGCSIVPVKLDIRPINVIPNSAEEIALNKELKEIANEYIFNKKKIPLTSISKKFQNMTSEEFFKFYNEEYGFGSEDDPDMILTYPYYEYATDKVYSSSLLSNVIRVKFENQYTYIPQNYDEYLTSLYGDYMKFPNLESRVPANYEYHSFEKPKYWMKDFIKNPPHQKLFRLIKYIQLFGVSKFVSISKEKRM